MEININDTVLFYEKSGTGDPLILLHGNGEDHHIFDKLAFRLKNHFTVYALDSRNHGLSRKTDKYSYAVMADDLLEFIKALRLSGSAVLGFSDGAITALSAAAADKNSVGKMLLLGVNLKPEDFSKKDLKAMRDEYKKTGDPLLNLMLKEPNIDIEDLRSISIPVLIAGAENDVFDKSLFYAAAEAIPGAKVLIMKGHTHDSYVSGSDVLYPEIIDFLLHDSDRTD